MAKERIMLSTPGEQLREGVERIKEQLPYTNTIRFEFPSLLDRAKGVAEQNKAYTVFAGTTPIAVDNN